MINGGSREQRCIDQEQSDGPQHGYKLNCAA
jgi:hypothetical protein